MPLGVGCMLTVLPIWLSGLRNAMPWSDPNVWQHGSTIDCIGEYPKHQVTHSKPARAHGSAKISVTAFARRPQKKLEADRRPHCIADRFELELLQVATYKRSFRHPDRKIHKRWKILWFGLCFTTQGRSKRSTEEHQCGQATCQIVRKSIADNVKNRQQAA